jgi:uncharacterized surface protein with fasciclin (FAS1) repeats
MKSKYLLISAFLFVVLQAPIAQGQQDDSITVIAGKNGQKSAGQKKLATMLFPEDFHHPTGQTVETVLRSSGQYTTFLSLAERAGLVPLLKGTVQDTTYAAVTFVEGGFDNLPQMSSGDMQISNAPGGRDVTGIKSQVMDKMSDLLTDAAKYALAQEGQVTVFAPTNAAFAKLPTATRKALAHDSTSAATFVLSYLVNRGVYTQGFPKIVSLQSMAGAELKVGKSASGNATINGISVVGSELVGDNGAVHGLDNILPSTAKGSSPSSASQSRP